MSDCFAKDSLVIYFSRTGDQYKVGNITEGNTAIVAKIIASQKDADIFEIKPVNDDYNLPYRELTELANDELEKKHVRNIRELCRIYLNTMRFISVLLSGGENTR